MKEKIHKYKVVKVIELIVFLILEIIFLIVLISNKTMRSSIFTDLSLYILCMIAYLSILLTFGMLIYDFVKLKELKAADHQLENLAFIDNKTGMPNRTSVNIMSDTYKTPESMKGLACVLSEISNLKEINEEFGKTTGDKAIADFSKIYETSAEGFGFVARNGGNEFLTVIEKCDSDRLKAFSERMQMKINSYNESNEKFELKIHSESALFDSEEVKSFSELIAKAYKKLGR